MGGLYTHNGAPVLEGHRLWYREIVEGRGEEFALPCPGPEGIVAKGPPGSRVSGGPRSDKCAQHSGGACRYPVGEMRISTWSSRNWRSLDDTPIPADAR